MADNFSMQDAEQRHYDRMRRMQDVRDALTREIEFYYDRVPQSEEEEGAQEADLRNRVRPLRQRIDDLLAGM